jgi:hypothetical protein
LPRLHNHSYTLTTEFHGRNGPDSTVSRLILPIPQKSLLDCPLTYHTLKLHVPGADWRLTIPTEDTMSRFIRRSWLASCVAAATLLAATALVAQADAQAAETLRIGGTGSALGGMQRLADAFMADNPDVRVVVLPSLGSAAASRR